MFKSGKKKFLNKILDAEVSETIKVRMLGLGIQIVRLPAQRVFVLAGCHAHSKARKRPTSFLKFKWDLFLIIKTDLHAEKDWKL